MKRWSDAEVEKLREFAAAGMSMREAAAALGRTHPSVVSRAGAAGIAFRGHQTDPSKTIDADVAARRHWSEIIGPMKERLRAELTQDVA